MGELAEAEALYRELAILNPQHARRDAGAGRAGARAGRSGARRPALGGGAAAAADRTRGSELLDIRQRLGTVYAEISEWASARYYLELVLAQDPGAAPALEILLEALRQARLPRGGGDACGRLARLHVRAGDGARRRCIARPRSCARGSTIRPAALDVYLRSSDLDPASCRRACASSSTSGRCGDLDVVADIANDLAEHALAPESEADLIARLAIAGTTLRGGAEPRFPFGGHPALAPAAARAMAEVAAHFERDASRGVDALDSMLMRARIWAGADGRVRGSTTCSSRMVLEDPGQPGAADGAGAAGRARWPAGAGAALPTAWPPS